MLSQASYKAHLPRPSSLRIVQDEDFGEVICGEYYATAEVFVSYYDAVRASARPAPHIEFSNCQADAGSILAFTKRWGPLQPNSRPDPIHMDRPEDGLFRRAFPNQPTRPSDTHFAFFVSQWRDLQSQFRDGCRLLASNKAADKRSAEWLWPHHQTLGVIQSGGLRFEPDCGTPFRELFEFWRRNKIVKTEGEARRLAQRMGIFAPESEGDICFKLIATSLLEAFWLMLAVDHSRKSAVAICANEKCQRLFNRDRENRKYCSHDCAQRVSSLSYYHRVGRDRRAKRMEDGDARKPVPSRKAKNRR